ncbi:MAG: UDP-2,3-diacylglucosamine hydrolase [bacterium P3]|nr:MAG: UDP-2,3-diacylglucosamine hydrolase [bacterium P3]KWW42753.1 MAG: UDP-2,3-diacylglucosamine hydrolase [bacterium F083]
MGNKLYFVTDAHLGAGRDSRERERELCALLDAMKQDAAMVVLLGDMFDFWFSYRHVVPRGYIRLLGKLAELADAGVELHYFVGNHDMWMFDYLEREMCITMHEEPAVLEFGGRRFLMGHGDGLGHLDRRYDLLRLMFRNKMNQWLFSCLPEWMTFGIALRWIDSSKQKHRREDLCYKGEEGEGIVRYCKERMAQEDIDFCVFGHRHTPLQVTLSTRCHGHEVQYVNVGDWFTHRSYACFDGSRLELIDATSYADSGSADLSKSEN